MQFYRDIVNAEHVKSGRTLKVHGDRKLCHLPQPVPLSNWGVTADGVVLIRYPYD